MKRKLNSMKTFAAIDAAGSVLHGLAWAAACVFLVELIARAIGS